MGASVDVGVSRGVGVGLGVGVGVGAPAEGCVFRCAPERVEQIFSNTTRIMAAGYRGCACTCVHCTEGKAYE